MKKNATDIKAAACLLASLAMAFASLWTGQSWLIVILWFYTTALLTFGWLTIWSYLFDNDY